MLLKRKKKKGAIGRVKKRRVILIEIHFFLSWQHFESGDESKGQVQRERVQTKGSVKGLRD